LKKLLLILSILLLTTTVKAQSQTRTPLANGGLQSSILRFYPNPATTIITFDFQRSYEKGYSIQIYNAVIGRKMIEQTNIADKTPIDLSNFTRGVYVYQLFDRTGKLVETGKFQVSK
jgi:type IX secretion system substrate protein